MPSSNGLVIWEGPSLIDGEDIGVILTGVSRKSSNTKTGHMLQTWILRSDLHPVEAIRRGKDISICGNCQHRGEGDGTNRSCYVTMMAPGAVWKTWRRGGYREGPYEPRHGDSPPIRVGSYGDPCAVPLRVWESLLEGTAKHTGYTHLWKKAESQPYKSILMASVDEEKDYPLAQDMGWRTFRVKRKGDSNMDNEISCPASEEMGFRTTCAKCTLCMGLGSKGKNISIEVHGKGAKFFDV